MHRGDAKDVLVQYKLDHSSFVNRQLMPVKDDLRREIERLMSRRNEQVLSFEADEKLTYGEVSAILSDLRKDDPDSSSFSLPRNRSLCLMTRNGIYSAYPSRSLMEK
jgi:biopolymer transport protein ExbD